MTKGDLRRERALRALRQTMKRDVPLLREAVARLDAEISAIETGVREAMKAVRGVEST